jgi:DNA-directed RNA polymerase specialized sigma subunit
MSKIQKLTEADRSVVLASVKAILDGGLIDDEELTTRLGVDREELQEAANFIEGGVVSADPEVVDLAVNNSLVEISFGIPQTDEELAARFGISRKAVNATLDNWNALSE